MSPFENRHCSVEPAEDAHVREMKEERSKQGQTNKAKQHNTPKAVTFPEKNELPRVGLKPTTLHSRQSALPAELPQAGWAQSGKAFLPDSQVYIPTRKVTALGVINDNNLKNYSHSIFECLNFVVLWEEIGSVCLGLCQQVIGQLTETNEPCRERGGYGVSGIVIEASGLYRGRDWEMNGGIEGEAGCLTVVVKGR